MACPSFLQKLARELSPRPLVSTRARQGRRLTCLCSSVFLTFSLTFSVPSAASAFSFETRELENRTELVFHLDGPEQIAHAQRGKGELVLRLREPCGVTKHLWHATDKHALLRAVLLEYDHIRVKFSSQVTGFWLTRQSPTDVLLTVQGLGEVSFDEFSAKKRGEGDLSLQPIHEGNRLDVVVQESDRSDLRRSLQGVTQLPYSELKARFSETSSANEAFPAWAIEVTEFGRKPWGLSDVLTVIADFFVTPLAAAEHGRALSIEPNDIRARVNLEGPEKWPEQEGLGSATKKSSSTGNMLPGPTPAQAAPVSPTPSPYSEITLEKQKAQPKQSLKQSPQQSPTIENKPREFPRNEVPTAVDEPVRAEKPAIATPASSWEPIEHPAPSAEENHGDKKHGDKKKAGDSGGKKENTKSAPTVHPDTVIGKASKEKEGLVQETPAEGEKEEHPREVIYVDENGNPVEKPLDIVGMLKEVDDLVEQKKFEDALVILNQLRASGKLDAAQTERVLYLVSDCYWFRYERDQLAGFDDIVAATHEALNFNLRSERVPDALLRLSLINTSVGNIEEGEGFIMALLRRYPVYPGAALGLTKLAKALSDRERYAQAEKFYTIVLDRYPESAQLQDASVGLIHVFYKEQKYDRARLILDFVNKRWPRQYVKDPNFLLTQAAIEKEFSLTDRQVQSLWLYYNLLPNTEHTVPMFLEMGDIYLRANNPLAAGFLYEEILQRAPESEEAITAQLRLAEKGFFSPPLSLQTMFMLFGRGSNPPFWKVYQEAAAKSKTYPDAILARLKYALWLLWDKQYPEAMAKASEFIDEYPDFSDKKLAETIIWNAFQEELALAFSEENYIRIIRLWNAFPLVRDRYGTPDAKLRYALAMGQKALGNSEGAMEMLRTFIGPRMDPTYGERVFLELFNLYLANGNWNEILDLGKEVASWNLSQALRRDLTYAMALSAQNLQLAGTALSLWQKIANDPAAQTYQKAWAMVFLAQESERRKDIRQAYANNLKVIDLFTQLQEERSDKADPERIKNAMISLMDICEVANRIPEALQWVNRYHAFSPDDPKEYPSLRYRESRLYRKLGDANRAQALLEEIIKNYPDSPYAQAAKTELDTFEISRDLQNFQASQGNQGSGQ